MALTRPHLSSQSKRHPSWISTSVIIIAVSQLPPRVSHQTRASITMARICHSHVSWYLPPRHEMNCLGGRALWESISSDGPQAKSCAGDGRKLSQSRSLQSIREMSFSWAAVKRDSSPQNTLNKSTWTCLKRRKPSGTISSWRAAS